MQRTTLGRTDVEVSRIALGTWAYGGEKAVDGRAVGWEGHDADAARAALARAHAGGIDHWDTADVYGDGQSEKLIGEIWQDVPRGDVFLASKVGWDAGGHTHFYHPEMMRGRIERSLRLLRTEVIDLYYLHHCDFGPEDAHLDDAVDELRRFRDEGKVRFIGLSDWSVEKVFRVIERVDPDVVQLYRNLLDDDYAGSPLSEYVAEHRLGVAFFSPLKHGLLTGKYLEPRTFSDGDIRSGIEAFADVALLQHLRRCRDAVGERFVEHPQAVLHAITAPLLADSPTASLLLGQRNVDQVDAAATLGGEMSAADVDWVRRLYSDGR